MKWTCSIGKDFTGQNAFTFMKNVPASRFCKIHCALTDHKIELYFTCKNYTRIVRLLKKDRKLKLSNIPLLLSMKEKICHLNKFFCEHVSIKAEWSFVINMCNVRARMWGLIYLRILGIFSLRICANAKQLYFQNFKTDHLYVHQYVTVCVKVTR